MQVSVQKTTNIVPKNKNTDNMAIRICENATKITNYNWENIQKV